MTWGPLQSMLLVHVASTAADMPKPRVILISILPGPSESVPPTETPAGTHVWHIAGKGNSSLQVTAEIILAHVHCQVQGRARSSLKPVATAHVDVLSGNFLASPPVAVTRQLQHHQPPLGNRLAILVVALLQGKSRGEHNAGLLGVCPSLALGLPGR